MLFCVTFFSSLSLTIINITNRWCTCASDFRFPIVALFSSMCCCLSGLRIFHVPHKTFTEVLRKMKDVSKRKNKTNKKQKQANALHHLICTLYNFTVALKEKMKYYFQSDKCASVDFNKLNAAFSIAILHNIQSMAGFVHWENIIFRFYLQMFESDTQYLHWNVGMRHSTTTTDKKVGMKNGTIAVMLTVYAMLAFLWYQIYSISILDWHFKFTFFSLKSSCSEIWSNLMRKKIFPFNGLLISTLLLILSIFGTWFITFWSILWSSILWTTEL